MKIPFLESWHRRANKIILLKHFYEIIWMRSIANYFEIYFEIGSSKRCCFWFSKKLKEHFFRSISGSTILGWLFRKKLLTLPQKNKPSKSQPYEGQIFCYFRLYDKIFRLSSLRFNEKLTNLLTIILLDRSSKASLKLPFTLK